MATRPDRIRPRLYSPAVAPEPEQQAERVWRGAAALEPFLVPISELQPFEGNPRRGDVPLLRASLARFGQTKPVLTDAQDERRIVAGRHITLAAQEEGWTHVAAIPNEFENDEEARAFLLADNRTHDLGGYDLELLVAQLGALVEEEVPLDGIGYDESDYEQHLADLRRSLTDLDAAIPPQPREPDPPRDTREVVLKFSPDQHRDFENWAGMISRERGLHGVSEIVYEALKRDAASL